MSKELKKTENADLMFDPSNLTKETIKNYLCKEATDQELTLGLQIAKTCGLNPIKREVYFIKYGNNPMMVVTGYEVYLKRAEASGQYDGMELTSEGNIKDGSLKAMIKVYRKDWTRPLVHEVYYSEYVQSKSDGTPNKFWKEKPVTMIKKVAISQGFRMAFPEQLQGLPYTSDESIDQEHVIDIKLEPQAEVKEHKAEPKQTPKEEPKVDVMKTNASKAEPLASINPSPAVPVAGPNITSKEDTRTVQGVIIDKKVKPFVTNGKAGNKYGCKIEENWYGTFDTKTYDLIIECQENRRLVNLEYKESPVTTDGKTVVYYNIVSLRVVRADEVNDI